MKLTVNPARAVRGSRGAARRRAGAVTVAAVAAAVCGLVFAGAGGAGAAQATAQLRPPCPAPVFNGTTATVTCGYTGAAQYWTVPPGVTQATFTLYGAAGAGGADAGLYGAGTGGAGAEVTGTLTVKPGTMLQVNAGQGGTLSGPAFGGGGRPGVGAGWAPGQGGGGGGGASDVRDGSYGLADRLLVAGGGGGGGATGYPGDASGGAGGDAGSEGEAGGSTTGSCDEGLSSGGAGAAGTAKTGGAGGEGSSMSDDCQGTNTHAGNGAAGSKGTGGTGGGYKAPGNGGGGGGGGYYGGGGGGGQIYDDCCAAGAGGGGGGSSYTGTASDVSVNDDPASPPSAYGEVTITYPHALTQHSLAGSETEVSCLTASLCVAAGSRGDHGAVVSLRWNGTQISAAVLRGSSVIHSVSCRKSGCWAIGRPDGGVGAYLVKISSAGHPVAERKLTVPSGVTLGPISCTSMTSCEVVGHDNNSTPAAIEIGSWNGTKLRLYQVKVAGSTRVSMTAISCWRSVCEAVGSAQHGLILTTAGGKPGKLNSDSGYELDGISCVSATTCYATGGGVLVTVTRGVAANPQVVTGDWAAIECTGTVCEAAGWGSASSASQGVLQNLSDGTAGPFIRDYSSDSFSGIAARGNGGFIAIGIGGNCSQGTCTGTMVAVA